MSTQPVTIRSLGYSDLPQVIAIERRAFPTPWSLAMFVLELSKPSGVCLAAIEERRIVGYLICSRYADVWHLMNIAVDPPRRRRGIATALLEEMIERAGRRRVVHARGASVEHARDRPVRAVRLPLGGHAAALLPGHRRGRADHVAHGGYGVEHRAHPGDPRARDELRRHLRGGRHAGGEIRSNVISSQGVHDRYGGVVPEIASRHHLELIGDVVDDALARADVALPGVDLVAVTCGPGLVAALLVGVATAKGLAAAHGLPLAAGRPSARPRRRRVPRARRRSSRRSSA